MSVIEIVLLIAGIICLVLGFVLPAKDKGATVDEAEVRRLVEKEIDAGKDKIADAVDEKVQSATDQTERAMERLSNEKIMAMNEYSDTVLEDINKNHKEVLFLYDMLNDKHESLKTTISEVTKAAADAGQAVNDARILAQEAEDSVRDSRDAAQEVAESAEAAKQTIQKAMRFIDAMDGRLSAAEQGAPVSGQGQSASAFAEGAPQAQSVSVSGREAGGQAFVSHDTVRTAAENPAEAFKPIAPPRVKVRQEELGDFSADTSGSVTQSRTHATPLASLQNRMGIPVDNIESGRNNNEKILRLHKQGKSNVAVARELGLGVGEVKLVIDLYEG